MSAKFTKTSPLFSRLVRSGLSSFLVVSLLITSLFSSESQADLGPNWVGNFNYSSSSNETYLSDIKKDCSKESAITLLDEQKTLGFKQGYEDISREYAMKERYGVTDLRSEYSYKSQVHDFSQAIFNEVKHYNNRAAMSQIKDAEKRDPSLRYYSIPAVVAATLAQAAAGKPIMGDLDLATDVKIHAEGVIPDKAGHVQLSSPIVDTILRIQGGTPSTQLDPMAPLALDMQDRQERYRISMSRTISPLTLTPGIEYGSTSSTMAASLTKGLAPNLSCVVETIRPLNTDVSSMSYAQDRIRVGYAIHF